ncbi:MAG: VWA domain-containing protein, partial [Oscillospiraceae bacterium]|nr:VWA domain-containing protein [Oscillospiraceae bacterium]
MKKFSFLQRAMGLFLCLALIASYVPLTARAAEPVALSADSNVIVDPSTADDWEHMMGTDTDGNRYAGRVWADRSVYKDGDTVVLNSRGESGSSFKVALEEDESFQVVFSVLGSTMTSTSTVSSTGPMDVVLVLDISPSMTEKVSDDVSRLQMTIAAANTLIDNLLKLDDMRLGIVTYSPSSEVLLPLAAYNDGIVLSANDSNCAITVRNSSGQQLKVGRGYGDGGTNLQSGIDTGMKMLAEASNPKDRMPVLIPLTDGQANYAVTSNFYNISAGSREYDEDGSSGVVLSTLLNAAYNKVLVEKHYGKAPKVYGVTVDLKNNAFANALMDPANSFNSSNSSSAVKEAYEEFENWAKGDTVTIRKGNWLTGYTTWTFNHNFPASPAVTTAEVAENINYVDKHYDVSSDELNLVFTQIYKELSSAAFNPITSSTSSAGGTGVDDTPLIYADYIGQYMEIKEIEAITLFGASYGVIKHADGTYTVTEATGTNPTTNENWNTAEDIRITVIEEADGTQKLEIRINQEILPITLEEIDAKTVGNKTTATITELKQEPLRVMYTIGVDSDILLPNGKVDVSKLQGYAHINDADGTVTFYANQFGEENPADSSGTVLKGDSHVGFQPSPENRYYYHQKNQGIFTAIIDENGKTVTIPENNEYGIVWNDDYDLHWMTYEDYQNVQDTDKVYTYVTYYHPTPSTADAANAAEEVTYLVYTDWLYLKESVAFYDNNTETYLNDGKAIPEDQVAATIAAYLQANPDAELYAVLGIGSRRTSRLHNMMHDKVSNDTETAVESYTPEYLENKQDHHGNDVVIWLGNNGKLTVEVETGIVLTKQVTEAIGNASDTYALTVTVPAGVTAEPAVVDQNGNTADFTYSGNVLTVQVKAGQTVYISGIPGGTVCTIDENVDGDYYISGKTDSVTVPLVSQAISTGVQFVPATVTNAPNKYGDLTIIKDIDHSFDSLPTAMAGKVFTFKVELTPYTAGDKYQVDKAGVTGEEVTVGADGSFTVELKDNESITILGIPAGTAYTVTEIANVPGYTPVEAVLTGTIQPDGDHDAHFVNVYGTTPIKPAVTVTGTKTLVDVNGTYTADEAFTFALHQYIPGTAGSTGSYTLLAEATAKAGESYTFSLADVLAAPLGIGEHYFRVTEASGTTAGMSYDASRGLFVVRITDEDADGTLEFSVADVGNTTVSGTTVTKDFVNTYDVARTHADIKIVKVIGQNDTGVNIPLNLFHFQLKNLTFSDNAPPMTVTTDAAGNAVIRLPELVPGQYIYTLTEKDEGMPGMVYDTTPRTVIVTVEENSGVLTTSVEIDGVDTDTATFRNDYVLSETYNVIGGAKLLEGRAPIDGEFRFSLYETDATFVLAPGTAPKQTVTNVGGAFTFDPILHTQVGTYYYSIKEENTAAPGVTYDTTHYH